MTEVRGRRTEIRSQRTDGGELMIEIEIPNFFLFYKRNALCSMLFLPVTRNPQPVTRNTQPETRNPELEICNLLTY
jgi:hypothetical protein